MLDFVRPTIKFLLIAIVLIIAFGGTAGDLFAHQLFMNFGHAVNVLVFGPGGPPKLPALRK